MTILYSMIIMHSIILHLMIFLSTIGSLVTSLPFLVPQRTFSFVSYDAASPIPSPKLDYYHYYPITMSACTTSV